MNRHDVTVIEKNGYYIINMGCKLLTIEKIQHFEMPILALFINIHTYHNLIIIISIYKALEWNILYMISFNTSFLNVACMA